MSDNSNQHIRNNVDRLQRLKLGAIAQIRGVDPHTLEYIISMLRSYVEMYGRLLYCDLDLNPEVVLTRVANAGFSVHTEAAKLIDYAFADDDAGIQPFGPILRRNTGEPPATQPVGEFIQQLSSEVYSQITSVLMPVISYSWDRAPLATEAIEELRRTNLESRVTLDHFRNENSELATEGNRVRSEMVAAGENMKQKLEEADTILNDIVGASGRAGIALYARIFSDESKRHGDAAWSWLAVSCLALLSVISSSYWLLNIDTRTLVPSPMIQARPVDILQALAPRLFIVTALYYGLIFCVRNYNAARHNQIVNRHRQNALSTFQVFVSATDDDAVKNAVLMQATHCIFSNSISGYIPQEQDTDQSGKLIDMIKTIGTAK